MCWGEVVAVVVVIAGTVNVVGTMAPGTSVQEVLCQHGHVKVVYLAYNVIKRKTWNCNKINCLNIFFEKY